MSFGVSNKKSFILLFLEVKKRRSMGKRNGYPFFTLYFISNMHENKSWTHHLTYKFSNYYPVKVVISLSCALCYEDYA